MPDDSLERKGSSENRNAIWKTYNWFKILQATEMKTRNQFQACLGGSARLLPLLLNRVTTSFYNLA